MNELTLFDHVQKLKKVGDRYKFLCPCHDDHSPSASGRIVDGMVLAHCHACGANGLDMAHALGLDWTALGYKKKDNTVRTLREDYDFLVSRLKFFSNDLYKIVIVLSKIYEALQKDKKNVTIFELFEESEISEVTEIVFRVISTAEKAGTRRLMR